MTVPAPAVYSHFLRVIIIFPLFLRGLANIERDGTQPQKAQEAQKFFCVLVPFGLLVVSFPFSLFGFATFSYVVTALSA